MQAMSLSRGNTKSGAASRRASGLYPDNLGLSMSVSNALRSISLRPFDTAEVKVLLLENVNETAIKLLTDAGYQVESHAKALPTEALIEKLRDVQVLGIRSKTKVTAAVLKEAKKLKAIGCFCIGTNQVDLEFAASRGVAVFNSPFSNSRSVAELALGEIIALSRRVTDRNTEMHQNVWKKANQLALAASYNDTAALDGGELAPQCAEIRGKKLGIIGYGHIGSQLSVLAEAMGMQVLFYDILQIMPLGTARPMPTLDDVLTQADFVTLHVPENSETKNMIGEAQIKKMKRGSYLLNLSRGTVVSVPALAQALDSGHIAGAGVDVFPSEPHANGFGFETELRGRNNVILTPHIGGSTEEAQSAIGIEVASALIRFINGGTSVGAVNFPECDLRVPAPISPTATDEKKKLVRVLNVHQNVPGVLKQINRILCDFNIEKQICDSKGSIAYLMADITVENDTDLKKLVASLNSMGESITTRILFG